MQRLFPNYVIPALESHGVFKAKVKRYFQNNKDSGYIANHYSAISAAVFNWQ